MLIDERDDVPMEKTGAAKYYKMAVDDGNISGMLRYGICAYQGKQIPIYQTCS